MMMTSDGFGWVLLPAAIVAFGLPGYFISVLLASGDRVTSTFCGSLVVLFQSIFWLGFAGIRLSFVPVLTCLLSAAIALAFCARLWRHEKRNDPVPGQSVPTELRVLVFILVAASGLLLWLLTARIPLMGPDTSFRWNFLSLQMLKEGSFAFYPPRSAQDFRHYFYPDGIPPLVSFSYWWLYASLGRAAPPVTSIFIASQYLMAMWIAYRLGCRLHSPMAGCWAVAALVGCTLFFFAVVLGQETGLTAISLGATLYFILEPEMRFLDRAMILAGISAGVGCLSREYGVIVVICGLATCLWRKMGVKPAAILLVTTAVSASPWYIRNWLLTGNPVYSNSVGQLFPVNPIHAAILETYHQELGMTHEQAWSLCKWLATRAPLQLVGLFLGLCFLRKLFPLILSALLFMIVWLYSMRFTSGGVSISSRVLSPAWLALSVAMGVVVVSLRLTKLVQWALLGLVLVIGMHAIYLHLPVSNAGNAPDSSNIDLEWNRLADRFRMQNGRILSDNAYVHAPLSARGIDVVPIWSPEVRFLFDQQMSPSAARQRLLALGIRFVETGDSQLNSMFLQKIKFFSQDAGRWTVFARLGTLTFYQLPQVI
jgi:hypothetical protein